jgi:hypothetical protein
VPIIYEIALWRTIMKINRYKKSGNKAFNQDKNWQKLKPIRRYAALYSMVVALILFMIMLLPLPHTATQIVSIPYATQYIQSSDIELGDKQVNQQGADGQGLAKTKYVSPIFSYIIGKSSGLDYSMHALPTETTQTPTNKIVANGTKKYQYMWCSSGAYRYYTNDQFKNPNTGFTHKSPDYCAQNGEGHMTELSDTAPPAPTTIYKTTPTYLPTYTTTHCYNDLLFGGITCSTY